MNPYDIHQPQNHTDGPLIEQQHQQRPIQPNQHSMSMMSTLQQYPTHPHHLGTPLSGTSSGTSSSSGSEDSDVDDDDDDHSMEEEDEDDTEDEKTHTPPEVKTGQTSLQQSYPTVSNLVTTSYPQLAITTQGTLVSDHLACHQYLPQSMPIPSSRIDRSVPQQQQIRKSPKRPSKEMSNSVDPPSPRRRQAQMKVDLEHPVDNRPRLPPVAGMSGSLPSSKVTGRVLSQRCTQQAVADGGVPKVTKKRKVTPAASSNVAAVEAVKPTTTKSRSRALNTAPLPLSAIHPPSKSDVVPNLLAAGEIPDHLGFNFASFLDSEGMSIQSVLSQICSRASRRMRDLDALRAVVEQGSPSVILAQAVTSPSEREVPDTETKCVTEQSTLGDDIVSSSVSSPSNSTRIAKSNIGCSTAQLQLARLAEVSERELRLAALQQHCFRILRNINLCFPGWASRNGSYLWHSAYVLGSTTLRDLTPYCVIFEEVWDDVQLRYADALRQAVEQTQAAKNQEGSSDVADFHPPKEVNGSLLTSLMFQGDSITYTNCLIQLDNLRHRIDASFEPIADFQEVLATFTAAQTVHSTQQPPVKFIFSPLVKFRSAADLSAGMGRGGKRKAALAALLGTPGGGSAAATGTGRGRAKKGNRGVTPSINQSPSGEAEVNNSPHNSGEPITPSRGKGNSGRRSEIPTTSNSNPPDAHINEDPVDATVYNESNPVSSTESLGCQNTALQRKKTSDQVGLSPYSHNEHMGTEDDWDAAASDDGNSSSDSIPLTSSATTPSTHAHSEASALAQQTRPHSSHPQGRPSPPSSPLASSRISPYNHNPYVPSTMTAMVSSSPQGMRPLPLISATGTSLSPAGYLPSNEALYGSQTIQQSHAAGMAFSGSPNRVQGASTRMLQPQLHLPLTSHAQPTNTGILPSTPAQQPHSNNNAANNLPPDAFELPRDPDSFRSAVKGVYYDDTSNRWCASWHERKTGKKRSRYFAVKKFGFTQAKTHAMDARLEAEESGECAPTNIN